MQCTQHRIPPSMQQHRLRRIFSKILSPILKSALNVYIICAFQAPLKSKIKFQGFSRTSRSSMIPEWVDRSHSTLELVKSGKPLHTTTQGTLCPSTRGWHWIQNLKVKVKDVSVNLSILNISVLLWQILITKNHHLWRSTVQVMSGQQPLNIGAG